MGSPKRQLISGTGSRTNAYTDFHHTVFYAACPTQTPDQFWKKPMLPMALVSDVCCLCLYIDHVLVCDFYTIPRILNIHLVHALSLCTYPSPHTHIPHTSYYTSRTSCSAIPLLPLTHLTHISYTLPIPYIQDALLDVMTTKVDDDRLEKERAAVLSEASMVNKMEYRWV